MRRWKEHTSASILKEHSHICSIFYSSYPNSLCTDKEHMNPSAMKGYRGDLSINLGIGIKKTNMTSVISSFRWIENERKELIILKGSEHKHSMKQKVYIFELAYALAIDPLKNI